MFLPSFDVILMSIENPS